MTCIEKLHNGKLLTLEQNLVWYKWNMET